MSGTIRRTDLGTDVKPTHGHSDVVENNTGDTHHKSKDDNLLMTIDKDIRFACRGDAYPRMAHTQNLLLCSLRINISL
jgi:hypothetical protein